ncbi:30kDa protein [Botrytis virus X]|uniref:Uncharacterized ORF2 protein n=1 Tax=Botrytis virus X (isolate Botrytis cinerea/New Zealand/Howitt/2006) TaxID=686947 RepID=ORF2_BOTVX|nr:30kDa protein [Botrytis virus X]Q6YNQ6.1 RecName: Full=Uncharacterized ORF2 protein [Botrytis virus X NZL/Howitt]AAL17723.1 30kDa protein [Botrytis virus X]
MSVTPDPTVGQALHPFSVPPTPAELDHIAAFYNVHPTPPLIGFSLIGSVNIRPGGTSQRLTGIFDATPNSLPDAVASLSAHNFHHLLDWHHSIDPAHIAAAPHPHTPAIKAALQRLTLIPNVIIYAPPTPSPPPPPAPTQPTRPTPGPAFFPQPFKVELHHPTPKTSSLPAPSLPTSLPPIITNQYLRLQISTPTGARQTYLRALIPKSPDLTDFILRIDLTEYHAHLIFTAELTRDHSITLARGPYVWPTFLPPSINNLIKLTHAAAEPSLQLTEIS